MKLSKKRGYIGKVAVLDIKEFLAEYKTDISEREDVIEKLDSACGRWATYADCESGLHHLAKKLVCGKEWCPDCGENRSKAHNRRIARVLPKAMKIKYMGYFVIEFPEAYRWLGQKGVSGDGLESDSYWCYSKEDLKETTNTIVGIMAGKRTAKKRRAGGLFTRGLLRWHWFGDKNTGKWNPHINILVDSAYIMPKELRKIKVVLRDALCCPDLIINYSFCEKPAQKFHKVEYITRATFKNYHWDEYMANQLYGFRNQRWWGDWSSGDAWACDDVKDLGLPELMQVSMIQKGLCPVCGRKLKTLRVNEKGQAVKWSKPIDSTYLIIQGAKEIGSNTGYYGIPDDEWQSGLFAARKVLTGMV